MTKIRHPIPHTNVNPLEFSSFYLGFQRDELIGSQKSARPPSVWNNDGDVAYLRNAQGQFVDHLTVGSPKRHPGGH